MRRELNIVLLFSLLFSVSLCTYAEQVTVVYPNVKAPYDTIFKQIIQGIDKVFHNEVIHLKLASKFDAEQTAQKITTPKVIALGRRGMRIAKHIYHQKLVVVGALPIKPNGIAGVSLMADPEVLFTSLLTLAPKTSKVVVIYSPSSAWIIPEAKIKAQAQNLTLVAISVNDIKSAVKAYNKLFEKENLDKTAIWLPLDPISAHEKIVIPVILEKAWEDKIVVFSSKPSHAKRGALFSVLPDNQLMGEQLAHLINTIDGKDRPSIVNTLKAIKLAVNLRTATHLGFSYSAKQRTSFALTFPN